MDTVKAGNVFCGTRNDGRVFGGVVASVRETVKGTLVVLEQYNGERAIYKSVYLGDMASFRSTNRTDDETMTDYIDNYNALLARHG